MINSVAIQYFTEKHRNTLNLTTSSCKGYEGAAPYRFHRLSHSARYVHLTSGRVRHELQEDGSGSLHVMDTSTTHDSGQT